MKKKILSLVLVLILGIMLIVLTGCGSEEILENDTKSESNSVSSKNDVEENNTTNTDNNINRVYNEAEDAADETSRVAAQTELEMAIKAVVSDWTTEKYIDGSSTTLEEYLTKAKVQAKMNTSKLSAFVLDTTDGVTVTYKGTDYRFTVEITSSGNNAEVTY